MDCITYIDRVTGREEVEQVYGQRALQFLYADRFFSRLCRHLVSCIPFCSSFYGFLQKIPFSRRKIQPFINRFAVNSSEFVKTVPQFTSFNDFFIRQLKPEARPLATGVDTAVMPADGRYLFVPHIRQADGFYLKNQKFNLAQLLQNQPLAQEYENGTMIIARLCPTDYHRFHFPMDCIPGSPRLINGYLYSVNPIAIKKNIEVFTQNKRFLTELDSTQFGKVLFMEIGATSVGTIHQTFTPGKPYLKGDEKGYFSFGGSALVLLFKPDTIRLDADLIRHSHREIKCLMGQSLGVRNCV